MQLESFSNKIVTRAGDQNYLLYFTCRLVSETIYCCFGYKVKKTRLVVLFSFIRCLVLIENVKKCKKCDLSCSQSKCKRWG